MAESKIVSVTKLDDTNYHSWKFKVKMLLIREGTSKCVQEPIPDDPDAEWVKQMKRHKVRFRSLLVIIR